MPGLQMGVLWKLLGLAVAAAALIVMAGITAFASLSGNLYSAAITVISFIGIAALIAVARELG